MNKQRREFILESLRRGGLIKATGERGVVPVLCRFGNADYKLTRVELKYLLVHELLMPVSCGCTGWWWTIRPDDYLAKST